MARNRDCKILATLGPSSDPPERLMMVLEAGVDCFRLNFSHGEKPEHAKRVQTIREAEARIGRPIGIIADLQGPKLRVSDFETGSITLRYGEKVVIEASSEKGHEGLIRMPHPEIVGTLQAGDLIKLDDGKLELTILGRTERGIEAQVLFGGELKNRKGVNVPSRRIPISALTERDRDHLAFELDQGVDYIALSFVQSPEDVREARALIGDRAGIVSKIEKPAALDELEEIVRLSDAIMVARGDLGVELAPEQVPIAQRRIVRMSRAMGKPVIVATHMLESMIDAPTPTRAEASDVATAVYQGADAVMLSAESAVGRHPATAVAIMDRIIRAVESDPDHWSTLARESAKPDKTAADAIAVAAEDIAAVLEAAMIVAYTETGASALRVSRQRPKCGVLSLTPKVETARRLALAWGVRSIVTESATTIEEMITRSESAVRGAGLAGAGDHILVVAGVPFGSSGSTNMLRVVKLD